MNYTDPKKIPTFPFHVIVLRLYQKDKAIASLQTELRHPNRWLIFAINLREYKSHLLGYEQAKIDNYLIKYLFVTYKNIF